MYEKVDKCPVCGFTSFSNHLICNDHHHSQESFAIVQCDKCTHLFTNPRPSPEQISRYYQSTQYISHTNKSSGIVTQLYNIARYFTLRWKSQLIHKYQKAGDLLDFGCGTGDFLAHMAKNSWSTTGIEPAANPRQIASNKGLTIYENLSDLNKESYDVITAWHVLEHIHDLSDTFTSLRKKLKNKGIMIIALPNPLSHDAIKYQDHWAGYDVPRHLHHFTDQSFEKLVTKHKLRVLTKIPMKLDSLYVSILSEKYLQSSHPLLKGLRSGFVSNRHASKTEEYSSRAFILSK